ncbi:MAG: alpha/beta hydrolase [Deltaproteobacteria bacterium]|nr:alpha/beta hydrolase [Deltaproteobacteria bacterium]
MIHSTTTAADGTRLAYRVRGEGPLVVFNDGLANDGHLLGPLLRRLEGRARLLTWHYRGHGDSENARDPRSISIESTVDDLRRVLDAVADPEEKAVFVGFSLGCQVNLVAWQRFPERVSAIVNLLGTYGRPFDTFFAPHFGRLALAVFRPTPSRVVTRVLRIGGRFSRPTWVAGRVLGIIESGASYGEFAPFLRHLRRLEGRSFKALALASQAHSAEDALPTVTVPTLVVVGGRDRFSLPRVGRRMHERIPGSELIFLPKAGHAGLLGHATPIGHAVEDFLERGGWVGAPGRDSGGA